MNAARVLVSNILAYSEEMRDEMLYGYEPRPPFMAQGWPVRADAWVMWGTAEIWMSEAYTRFRRVGLRQRGARLSLSILPQLRLARHLRPAR